MKSADEFSGAGLAMSVAAPQLIVLGFVVTAAAVLGYGWSLVALLGIATALSIAVAHLAWRLLLRVSRPPNLLLGALVGLVVGVAAAGLSFAAASADKHIGPRFGGALLGEILGASIKAGMQVGADAHKTGVGVIDMLTIPHRAIVGIAGGWLVMLLAAAVIVGAIALPIVTGLIGGFAAALRARRADRLRVESS